ncbi:CheR family methyltransferase [Methanosphaerula subterraneus]|uniref:CheR family methyltransferase n=1 Tax=Methanosphaerula subterraneus TaxID=3350244 RepID=UPI003F87A619
MPRSAIDARLADIIAPASDLPEKILAFVRHGPIITEPEPPLESRAGSTFDKFIILLRARTGHDFSLYKKNTVNRRVERRMAIHQIDRITDYVRFLQENPPELDLLFKELLIGVTSFFCDPAVWEELGDRVIPDLIAASPDGTTLRAWVAGCSTGEEALSLAIVFREALGKASPAKQCTLQSVVCPSGGKGRAGRAERRRSDPAGIQRCHRERKGEQGPRRERTALS